MTTPEDRDLWERDEEALRVTKYAEAIETAWIEVGGWDGEARAAVAVADEEHAALVARAEAAEAKVAKVEALVAQSESGGYWLVATHRIRAALADAPAEQRAEGGACREASFSENACAEHGGEWVYEDDGITLRPECSRADEFRDAQAGS